MSDAPPLLRGLRALAHADLTGLEQVRLQRVERIGALEPEWRAALVAALGAEGEPIARATAVGDAFHAVAEGIVTELSGGLRDGIGRLRALASTVDVLVGTSATLDDELDAVEARMLWDDAPTAAAHRWIGAVGEVLRVTEVQAAILDGDPPQAFLPSRRALTDALARQLQVRFAGIARVVDRFLEEAT